MASIEEMWYSLRFPREEADTRELAADISRIKKMDMTRIPRMLESYQVDDPQCAWVRAQALGVAHGAVFEPDVARMLEALPERASANAAPVDTPKYDDLEWDMEKERELRREAEAERRRGFDEAAAALVEEESAALFVSAGDYEDPARMLDIVRWMAARVGAATPGVFADVDDLNLAAKEREDTFPGYADVLAAIIAAVPRMGGAEWKRALDGVVNPFVEVLRQV